MNQECALTICGNDDFRQMLHRERLRADREESCFSLLFIYLKTPSTAASFIETLQKRLRIIDISGQIDNGCLGLILPFTKEDQAMAMYQSVIVKNGLDEHIRSVKTYVYPDKWFINGDSFESIKVHDPQEIIPQNEEDVLSATVVTIPLWKRIFDIIVSGTLLLLISPLLLLVTLYIKLVSKGPVFFIQKRVGYKGRQFDFYKFRTMHLNMDTSGVHETYVSDVISTDKAMTKMDSCNDNRIFRGARILRKTSIDELPQLLNVLKGDMSLVGPRPCIPYEAKEFLQWHKNRFDILPGMTGLWQVSGKNNLTFKQMIRLDIKYIKNISLFQDLFILVRTIPTVINLALEKTKMRLLKKTA